MLNDKQIKKLIEEEVLVENYPHLETQLQPNGFDLTVAKVFEYTSQGAVDFSNSERVIADAEGIPAQKETPDAEYGWWNLLEGAYKVRTNERINLPNDMAGYAYPRSTLLRNGAFTQTAFWDAGFEGRADFILVVQNPEGIRIKENARLAQIAFERIQEAEEGYNGMHNSIPEE